jgi:hypothetical protein
MDAAEVVEGGAMAEREKADLCHQSVTRGPCALEDVLSEVFGLVRPGVGSAHAASPLTVRP